MKCKVTPTPPSITTYDIHFTGLTELEAVALRCLVSDSEGFRKKASQQNRILCSFREAMDEDHALCKEVYSVVWEEE